MKFFLILLSVCIWSAGAEKTGTPNQLSCEYKINPLGIDSPQPRLSWRLPADKSQRAIKQMAYQIQVANDTIDLKKGKHLLWDSDRQTSDQSIHIPYTGKPLAAKQRYFWRVRIWDNQSDQPGAWSAIAYWEMALLDSTAWQAQWIAAGLQEQKSDYGPVPLLRKSFVVKNKIAKARIYITAHGLYEAFLNGERVGDDYFTPGWTSYHKRLQYQTYDVTSLLQNSKNTIGVRLGDGWYSGKLKWRPYGSETVLLCQLEIEYANGEKEIVISDDTWKVATGAVRMSNIFQGEVYDTRLEQKGWNKNDFDDQDWATVKIVYIPKGKLISTEGLPVRKIELLQAQKIIFAPNGDTLIDMGQNMVGWIQLTALGKPGDTITLHHAEVLDKEGNFYIANLRNAAQKVQYILNDTTVRSFEPHFTFQGFRYVKVQGLRGTVSLNQFTGVVIYSDMEKTGSFECSHPMINQLQSNIEWGQKGNFLDIPTDCPQRDERMGWTGDAQAFARTACYNFNTAAFYTKWLQDLAADQWEDGAVPWVIPDILNRAGSTGWADAVTIVPWTLYELYGDVRILERQYESMKKWLSYLEKLSGDNYLVQQGFHFGDWLFFIHPTDWNAKPGYTDIDFIATAFFAYSTQLTIQTARVLGKKADVERYEKLLLEIKRAFQQEFVTPSGRLSPHSQTAYTLALAFDLLSATQQSKAVAYLVADIKARNYHLSTGFLGTPHLCKVLSDHGQLDVAYQLLFQETYPSWLYPITKGATTIWERWDGIKPDGSFQAVKANSFNHYAYGAIGDWMYRVIAGIDTDSAQPGYKHIRIQPKPNKTLTYAKAAYDSMYGKIRSEWHTKGERFQLTVEIPPNTSATVTLPDAKLETVLESGQPISSVKGIFTKKQIGEDVQLTLGSGTYVFAYPR